MVIAAVYGIYCPNNTLIQTSININPAMANMDKSTCMPILKTRPILESCGKLEKQDDGVAGNENRRRIDVQ